MKRILTILFVLISFCASACEKDYSVDTSVVLTPSTALPTLDYGTYTPSVAASSNVTSSTTYVAQYMRVGNTVTVSGKIDVVPTLSATVTTIDLNLPIASNITNDYEVAGTCYGRQSNINTTAGSMSGLSSDQVRLLFVPTSGNGSQLFPMFFTFTYRII